MVDFYGRPNVSNILERISSSKVDTITHAW